MTNIYARREFLKTVVVGAGIAVFEVPKHARADNDDVTAHYLSSNIRDGRDPIHTFIHRIGDEHNRKTILGQATGILHSRFRDSAVARNAYQIARGHNIDGPAWTASNLEPHPTHGPREMLWAQLGILRLPNSAMEPGDTEPPFPEIHLYPFHQESNAWGNAPYNRVTVRWQQGNSWRRTGHFLVNVNTWHLGSAANGGADPHKWASVIAHEMLHNLGHRHGPDTGPQDYTNNLQINAFHRAVFCNGQYDGGRLRLAFG